MASKKVKLDDLNTIRARVPKDKEKFKLRVLVCGDTGCHASGSHGVHKELEEEIRKQELDNVVEVILSGCNGFCSVGPLMTVFPGGIFYQQLESGDMAELVSEHLKKDKPVERLMYKDPVSGKIKARIDEIPYFTQQHLRVMRNMGQINPESIDEYIWRDGYFGAAKALLEMEPRRIVEQMIASGLRGRGGGGFPTGVKWEFCANSKGDVKYVLCNADEGDPGAFMDRAVMEATPHAVLEGMIVAARAINSHQGYIYCRAEYPLAIKRLNLAIDQAREYGLLGKDILGSGFDFEIEIYKGAGAFVCGEETALMASIEGRRGMPRSRPPFPAVSGLWQKPTILNNVETYANVPLIIREGADKFSSLGTESSKGTKVFAVTGKVNNIGLVEVPMGTTVGQIVYDICGGIPGGKKYKAAQLGGPSGGCLPAEHLDTPVDYEAITKAGAIMGSGGMIVMDEDTCMVDMARYFMDFCQDESCGKCTPCRVGTRRMLEILERICRGEGEEGDIELLEEMASSIKDAALCGLGQTAPNPVLSTIRYFRDEYEAHIKDKLCVSAVCKGLYAPPCQRSCPVGVDVPAYNTLIAQGRFEEALEVIREDNPFPGVCGRLCSRPCEGNCIQAETGEAVAIRSLKRFVADQERFRWRPAKAPAGIKWSEKIAVIGSGPAGLTAARDLRREGYPVTVFEAASVPGGMLRLAIPDFKLPAEVVEADIRAIEETGVKIRTGTVVGRDVTLDQLREEGYKAVIVASGAHKALPLAFLGDNGSGKAVRAVDFLKQVKFGKAARMGGEVVVIGSTHAALDAARSCLRLGASAVGFIYPRGRDQLPYDPAEVKAAEEEGVTFHLLHDPTEVILEKEEIAGVRCRTATSLVPDRTGRSRFRPGTEEEVIVCGQTLIYDQGLQPDLDFLQGAGTFATGPLASLDVDPLTMETDSPDVFAAGDVISSGATVIEAIAAGQRVAASVHRKLRGLDRSGPHKLVKPRRKVAIDESALPLDNFRRPQEALRPASERAHDFGEADCTFSEMLAVCEARRCLRCGMD